MVITFNANILRKNLYKILYRFGTDISYIMNKHNLRQIQNSLDLMMFLLLYDFHFYPQANFVAY